MGLALALAGCSLPKPHRSAVVPDTRTEPTWRSVNLPGKRPTRYRHAERDGRNVILAESEASASMYRRRLQVEPERLGRIDFSWWVPALVPNADLRDRRREDSPVRVVLAFDGDHGRLSSKDRLLFELAETLSGEVPPFATLMYVWDSRSVPETVIPGGRTDRIRKIVVDSGPGHLGSWRHHQRHIVRDFERAFGEAPGRLIGVAVMTDSDNTASRAEAAYGELTLISSEGEADRLND